MFVDPDKKSMTNSRHPNRLLVLTCYLVACLEIAEWDAKIPESDLASSDDS